MRRNLWLLPIIILANGSYLEAFEISTHQILNERAVRSTSLDDYLRSNLDITNGITQNFRKGGVIESVLQWIIDGGAFEDQGNYLHTSGRYYNHFHNPLKPWKQAGLSVSFQGVTFLNESSLLWAQEAAGTQQLYGNYSWHDARDYFYKALTSPNPADRDQAFADTFRAVGQVMHLVEDASVPAHTRNDAHLLPNYETWVQENENTLNTTPIPPNVSLSVSIDGMVPITQLWDTNQYDGSLPLTGTEVGLAEYTNANFLSDDTIFVDDPNDRHYFPYPNKAYTALWEDPTNHRQYLRSSGRGEPMMHAAATSLLYFYRLVDFPQYNAYLPLALDDLSYKEQANKLVPRAVGYSARLLNYFFRGSMDARFDQVSNSMPNIMIANNSDEGMNGLVSLYYDDKNNQRELAASWTISLAAHETKYGFSFASPPDSKNYGTFVLVFRGTLGAESDAVMGKVVDIGLPGHVFIIQDSVNFGAPRVVDQTMTIPGRSVSLQTIDSPDQYMEGHFVTFGEIQSIDAYYPYSDYQFFVNGQLIAGHSWKMGDTPSPPATWKIQAIGEPERSYDCGGNVFSSVGGAEIVAVLKNHIASIITPLWVYDRRNINYCSDLPGLLGVGAAYKYSKHDSSPNTIDTRAAVLGMSLSGSSMVPLVEEWKINQLGGFMPEDSYTRQDSGSDWSYYEFRGSGMSIYQQPFYSHLWNSVNYDPIEVNLNITGEFERQYGAQELEFLSSIGIEPIYYTVIAQ
jgi:hypothetical protein